MSDEENGTEGITIEDIGDTERTLRQSAPLLIGRGAVGILAGILLLWGRNLDSADMIVNVVFTAYLIIGATLEEKKLVKEFGDDYLEYKRTVSMLVPFKWLKRCSKNMFNY